MFTISTITTIVYTCVYYPPVYSFHVCVIIFIYICLTRSPRRNHFAVNAIATNVTPNEAAARSHLLEQQCLMQFAFEIEHRSRYSSVVLCRDDRVAIVFFIRPFVFFLLFLALVGVLHPKRALPSEQKERRIKKRDDDQYPWRSSIANDQCCIIVVVVVGTIGGAMLLLLALSGRVWVYCRLRFLRNEMNI